MQSPGGDRHRRLGRLGKQGKADYLAGMSSRNPARRIGTVDDIANGVLFAMTNTFLTCVTLHIDGGEQLT